MDVKLRFLALILILAVKNNLLSRAEDNFNNFNFKSGFHADSDKEIMLAQESRQKLTVVEPPISIVKPKGVVNSHRPQYDIDSLEADYLDKYKYSNKLDHLFDAASKKSANRFRSREAMIRDAVLKALEKKDHVGKFAQIIPIVRAMTDSQRIALASLVASQVITPPGRSPLNLSQVRSMFDDGANSTSELMLPILFDMANLIRRAARSGKQPREANRPLELPSAHALRRSSDAEEIIDLAEYRHYDRITVPAITTTTTKKPTRRFFQRSLFANRSRTGAIIQKKENISKTLATDLSKNDTSLGHTSENNGIKTSSDNSTKLSAKFRSLNLPNQPEKSDDSAHQVDATNQTSTQDLPVAEKLRALTRFVDRQGNIVRRGQRPPNKPSITVTRRTTAEPPPIPPRMRTVPTRKLPADPKCELFTNSLCLHVDDYPLEAILLSIRRNKATTSALLADYRDPNEGAIDGVTAAPEAKYTADHYLASNRRGDTANRDFAGAGEGGFMCPSSVKYARPQRARATSGQWKYIVNTGEHTQTLRLEKCLKPKESCTYLNENFKSKCVQVYNYHRLLTWDQQNGLHMDIFKIPTCCSCHIEGYSVSFPPLVQNIRETPLEHFPGEAISPDHGNGDFESIQPTAPRPSVIKNSQYGLLKPTESFSTFRENQNFIAEAEFPPKKIIENDDFSNGHIAATAAIDSYGNNYFLDSFNEASSIKNIKRPTSARKPVRSNNFESSITLPSFLQPPTPTADSAFALIRDSQTKYKSNGNSKRGFSRLNRKPSRKNISGGTEDLLSSGTSVVDTQTSAVIENSENFRNQKEEYYSHTGTINKATIAPKLKSATPIISSESIFLPTLPTVSENRSVPRDAIQGKRVNYNYHPIIDFFEDNEKHDNGKSSIDRGDSVSTLIPMQEMDWKPINTPILT